MPRKQVKHIRPWRYSRIAIRAVLLLALLAVGLVVALMLPGVQTWLAGVASVRISAELGTDIRIGRVELRLFGPNRLHGVYIGDLKGDTLIAADEIWVRGLKVHPGRRLVEARRLELHRARFALARGAEDAHTNLTELLDKIAGPPQEEGLRPEPWTIRCGQVDIRDLHFSHEDAHYRRQPSGIDFSHIDIPSATIIGEDFLMAGDSILFHFRQLSLAEQSGLTVERMSGRARVAPRGIRVQGLHLVTAPPKEGSQGTDLRGDIDFRTHDLDDLDEFTTRVFMDARLDSSRLQFADVAYFAPDLQGVDFPISVGGTIQGRVNELKGRHMVLRFGRRSEFKGDIEMTGLPDVPNTFIMLDADHIRTNPADLAQVPVPPFNTGGKLQLPPEVVRLGNMAFNGNFTGFIHSFTTYGSASTEVGALHSDLSYERDTVSGNFRLDGTLATDGFDLGRVLGTAAVRRIAMDARIGAQGRDLASISGTILGQVPELGLEHYTIRNIGLNGKLEKNLFNGELHCDDPKVSLDFNGLADLRGRWPDVDFTADVHRLDLRTLGLIGGEGYSDIQMHVAAKGRLAPDSLQGTIRLEDVTYCQDSVDLDLGDIGLDAWHADGQPMVRLQSNAVDARIKGKFYPTLLPQAAQSVLFSIFPALQEGVSYRQQVQDFTYEVDVKHAQPVLDLVVPGLALGPDTWFKGNFNTRSFDLGLDAHLAGFGYGGFRADSLHVTLGKTMDLLAFSVMGEGRVRQDSLVLDSLYITGKAYQDEVSLAADWAGRDRHARGTINLNALVEGPSSISVNLEPSQVDFGLGAWANARTAHIRIDSSTVAIDTLVLDNGGQSIRLGGLIGHDPSWSLSFDLREVRTENLKPLYEGPLVHGSISGDGRIFNLYDKPYLLSYLCVDSMAIEDKQVGDLRFAATFNEGEELVHVNGSLERDTLRAFDFSGSLSPGRDQELDLVLRMDRLDLRFLNPYLPDDISDIQGKVTGEVAVKGRLASPEFNGFADLENAGLRINYLNTFYSFSHRVNILPDMFTLDQVRLHDDEGHWGVANGTIIHHGLQDWNFDVSMEMSGLKVLDTDAHNNELYYGKAYATGMLGFSGYEGNMEVDVDAATGEGTDIHFPLGGSQEVGGIPFVHFASIAQEHDPEEEEVDLTGIHLDLKVAVTPAARFELIFDPTVGDIMRGRGNGNITISVTPSGDLGMRGEVELVDGDYLFTLRNLVNKRFGVEPGGRITWYGDPFDALINVDAVYRLRASLYDVMPPAIRTEAYKKRFPVEVIMHLTQNLMNPEIGFDVKLPSVDEGVRTQVQSALATTGDMNRQVFSLIVLNRFLPSDANTAPSEGGGLGSATVTTGTELLSNQLSNWLSSFSSNLDLGVNWRTGDVVTQDEFEVAVSTAIFNDRLQLSTNVGVAYGAGGTEQGTNTLIGDFSAEYSLTQDGKLRLKAFSQSNDRNLNQVDQAQTTQGAGLTYREEFDTFGEFVRKLARLFGKRKPDRGN